MLTFARNYFYGEGTDHIVRLRPAEAAAVNKIRLTEVRPGTFRTNLTRSEMDAYNSAAAKLNAYLTDHKDVLATDEWLDANDILRPVK